jgi:peptidoglycan/LPS O-acetylase OafA/YrhL
MILAMQLDALPATPEQIDSGPIGPLPANASTRLPQIDILRAFACLWVLFLHGLGRFVLEPHPILYAFGGHGYLGVNLFMVLSGFCLARPIMLKGGWSRGTPAYKSFMKRRAIRILPPYFAAFFIFSALTWVRDAYPHAPVISSLRENSPTVGGFIAHLLMAQNLSPGWVNQVNGPFWSLALEFQFYAIFVLLALWFAKYGVRRLLFATLVLSLAWETFCVCRYGGDGISFELMATLYEALPAALAAFVAGMCVAQLVSDGAWDVRKNRWKWVLAGVLALAYTMNAPREWVGQNDAAAIGFGVLVLVFASMPSRLFTKSQTLVALEFIGVFSYSVYLVHRPLIDLFGAAILTLTKSIVAEQILLMPAILLVAYGFHLIFEKPFMRARPDRVSKLAPECAVTP